MNEDEENEDRLDPVFPYAVEPMDWEFIGGLPSISGEEG